MGEIADAMLNGDMCEGCGEWIGSGEGYPATCSGCGQGQKEREAIAPIDEWARFACTWKDCNRRGFKTEAARDQHMKAKHGGGS